MGVTVALLLSLKLLIQSKVILIIVSPVDVTSLEKVNTSFTFPHGVIPLIVIIALGTVALLPVTVTLLITTLAV